MSNKIQEALNTLTTEIESIDLDDIEGMSLEIHVVKNGILKRTVVLIKEALL